MTVIHTFGRDLKWNPHVHALVTEGAINNKYKWWKSVEYVPYEYLRKSWQKTLLDIIKKYFKDWKTKKLISVLYRKYKFIGKLVQQIHKKGFKCVRRYGLYSRKKNALAKEIIHLYRFVKQLKISVILNRKNKQEKKSWKQRIIETFNRNPLECRKCKREMELWKIWHDDYGLIYDIRESNYKEVKSDGSNRRILLRTKSNRERTYVQISMPQVWLRRMGTSICGR
ncbi:transposase [Caproiciproducens sp. MSJ-32]|uniref:transposase n=1 Tax=Caproiciproducens sp. MSJ-32 TaxID=2841527 RepID=UPI003FA4301B